MSGFPVPVPTAVPDVDPGLTVLSPRGPVSAVALVLHGGRARSTEPVERRQLAVARMVPFGRSLHRAGGADGLTVWLLRFRVRGWNGPLESPVADARWALDEVRRRHGDVPVHLVGHSMGARTALRVAGDPLVGDVVALAPWLLPGEPVSQLAGRRLLIAHGTRDRWTDPAESLRYAIRARDVAADVRRVEILRDAHPMLRRAPVWHGLTTAFVMSAMVGNPSVPELFANVLSRAAAGEVRLRL